MICSVQPSILPAESMSRFCPVLIPRFLGRGRFKATKLVSSSGLLWRHLWNRATTARSKRKVVVASREGQLAEHKVEAFRPRQKNLHRSGFAFVQSDDFPTAKASVQSCMTCCFASLNPTTYHLADEFVILRGKQPSQLRYCTPTTLFLHLRRSGYVLR